MARAKLRMSGELLADLLHLPEKSRILGSLTNGEYVEVIVEHPDIQAGAEHGPLPLVVPRYRRQPEVVFEGWGQ